MNYFGIYGFENVLDGCISLPSNGFEVISYKIVARGEGRDQNVRLHKMKLSRRVLQLLVVREDGSSS